MMVVSNKEVPSVPMALAYHNRMSSDVSHDIKNTLQAMNSAVDVLEKMIFKEFGNLTDHPELKEKCDKYFSVLDRVRRNSSRVENLVNELEHAHLGLETVNFERTNLKILLKNLVEDYQNTHSHGVRIYELHYAANTRVAVVDQNKLVRVVDNLLSNSTKYTKEGLIIIEVTETEKEWCIAVKDSGVGIPKGKMDIIFNRFMQAGGPHQKEGKGIGLSIVKQLSELHQGSIQASSIPGKRTVFKVFLSKNLPLGRHFYSPKTGSLIRNR